MAEYVAGPINEDYFEQAFIRWSMLRGAGAGENELLDEYASRFSRKLSADMLIEANANGMDTLPSDLVEIYIKIESTNGKEPSSMPTASKLLAREKIARILGAKIDEQYYVRASVVDDAYPADSKDILPCMVMRKSDMGMSVVLTDGAYTGTVFIVPNEAVSCVSVEEMKKISGGMF